MAEMTIEAMDTAPANLERLTRNHLEHYRRLIERAKENPDLAGNIRIEECRTYLRTWQSVEAARFTWNKLTPEAQAEITDAIEAGE